MDLWRGFPRDQKYRIAVSNLKPRWLKLNSSAFRRANNALERALSRTGRLTGNRLIARSVLANVITALDSEGLGKSPDKIRNKLLEGSLADVMVIADYYQVKGGVDMSLQAVKVTDGEVLATTREYKLSYVE